MMAATRYCTACGGSQLEPGSIKSMGKVYFRPTGAKFLTLKTANVDVHAFVCLQCGHLELGADPAEVAQLVGAEIQPEG